MPTLTASYSKGRLRVSLIPIILICCVTLVWLIPTPSYPHWPHRSWSQARTHSPEAQLLMKEKLNFIKLPFYLFLPLSLHPLGVHPACTGSLEAAPQPCPTRQPNPEPGLFRKLKQSQNSPCPTQSPTQHHTEHHTHMKAGQKKKSCTTDMFFKSPICCYVNFLWAAETTWLKDGLH